MLFLWKLKFMPFADAINKTAMTKKVTHTPVRSSAVLKNRRTAFKQKFVCEIQHTHYLLTIARLSTMGNQSTNDTEESIYMHVMSCGEGWPSGTMSDCNAKGLKRSRVQILVGQKII